MDTGSVSDAAGARPQFGDALKHAIGSVEAKWKAEFDKASAVHAQELAAVQDRHRLEVHVACGCAVCGARVGCEPHPVCCRKIAKASERQQDTEARLVQLDYELSQSRDELLEALTVRRCMRCYE